MFDNPNPDNKPVSDEEKDHRKFTVALVFIVVIGLSLVAFIFKFRQARNEVKQLQQQDASTSEERQNVPGLKSVAGNTWQKAKENPKNNTKEKTSNRGPDQSADERAKTSGSKLVPAKRGAYENDKVNKGKRSFPSLFHLDRQVEFLGDYERLGADEFLEVKNIKAFPEDMKARFSEDEIIGIKNDRVYAYIKEGDDLEEAMGVAYNTRTKRLGLLTGTLKVRFSDRESFDRRSQFIRSPFFEKRTFTGIKLSLIEGPSSTEQTTTLETLKSEQAYWQSIAGVKSVEVEVLEGEITVK